MITTGDNKIPGRQSESANERIDVFFLLNVETHVAHVGDNFWSVVPVRSV